ncbi:hypothetical protein G7068_13795 [Leucobacter viscericola]|uniref:Uncharacterized protein n=1 Tax=Leucobacter viscericola TaxID=2714935 RepID=A0A6G7XI15_9MICO|nr:hypothetical protein [Leucobacter viscericola]QIK64152.1 hypothetical protein G7068_13795 [Leucobacter viscericola]
MSRTYATDTDYASWLDVKEAPEGAARLLRDASLEVDEMLLTAIYRVDHDGAPTEPHVIEALRDATCAQAEYRAEHGDEATITLGDVPVSLGPLSIGGRSNSKTDGTALPQHNPVAVRILRLAGLIPGTVQNA